MTAAPFARFRALLSRHLDELVAEGIAREVASGLRCGEGPAYWSVRKLWVFADVPGDRMLAWSRESGLTSFRQPSDFSNGSTVCTNGDLVTCQHGTRRVVRTTPEGQVSVICETFDGRRLNSPNDVVEHADGSIWFSDPTYGIVSDVEGYRADPEQGANRVYRCDPAGPVTPEVDALKMPNGLCFSPDGATLYVADSGAAAGPDTPLDEDGPREVHAFPMSGGHVSGAGRIFARASVGVPDGLRCDEDGYLWVATGLGAECFAPDGTCAGAVETPETLTNLAFGDGAMMLTLETRVYLLDLGGR